MSIDPDAPEIAPPAPDLFDELAGASPADRAATLLRWIEAHPGGRVELEARDGLRANLEGASLRAAPLRKALLRGVNLGRADLQDGSLGSADLRDARLEEADLRRADLAGAVLSGAALGKANLRDALLEEADLRDASMRFVNLRGAALEQADLRGADLWGADLQDASLIGADLRGVMLKESNLQAADFSGANFEGATLDKADLRGAKLKDARLLGVVLATCNLTHVRLDGAWLERTRMRREQLGGAIGEDLAGDYEAASRGYLALERNFEALGDYDASSWAFLKRRRMQKLEAGRRARSELAARRWGPAIRPGVQYLGDLFVEWLCDYGESVPRVLGSLLALYVGFTALYGLTGSVFREDPGPAGVVQTVTHRPADLAIFSLHAMTTGSLGSRFVPVHDLALVLVGLHLLVGIALIGLLGFVLGNRIRR